MGLRSVSLPDILRRNAAVFGERTAFFCQGSRVSHRDHLRRVERLAAGLAEAGVAAGDRVAVLARNSLEFVDLYGAALWLGAILLPVNWRLSADEIAYILADGAPKLVIADVDYQPAIAALAGALAAGTGYYGLGGAEAPFRPFADLADCAAAAPTPAPGGDDGAVIIHTAAVDGHPRGALLSEANLAAAAGQSVACWQLDERDVGLVALPLFHILGLVLLLGVQRAGGASLILPKFEAEEAARLVAAERATVSATFAPMLGSLLDKAAEIGASLASLRAVTGLDGQETIARFEAACPAARFWAGYGQSEVSGSVTLSPWRERPGSAGRPTSFSLVAVVDELDRPLPAGEIGEIVVRGPLIFRGYWRREADNAVAWRNDWHHTGDLGRFDADGYLWYAGRSPAKELIKPGGENVYPAEVERTIREHAAIAEVAVIGVPDAQWGEAVKAICVCRPGMSVTAAALIDFVGGRIARYKKPKHVVFVASLPRSAAGQVDRAKVKEEHGRA
ncbi:MAG TPA: AMP-binding protein [Stellaceae bacterium]|nr:AMP-binding protein [Stellaceae bacterium]